MFRRILIANRGEIAIRIIRACREMGIETVAVHSTADQNSLHVEMATDAVCIGGPQAKDSYLNIQNILAAAISSGCDAIHPGYGFLAENGDFARLVEKCGMKFIGPKADVIDQMGNKAQARKLMIDHNVPVVPGSKSLIRDLQEAIDISESLGYPVLLKASAGGGGRGMRRAFNREELEKAFYQAKNEARAAFGNDDMYLEKLIVNPKHIEFQILADSYGNVIHLGERDCSIQRKNQKIMEEAPSKAISPELRERMGSCAIRAAKACGYENAGTIEFVLSEDKEFYFIEMNTRIQVEHPVTEMITGIDLIKEQIRIANGSHLKYKQEDIVIKGHAIECRINAEDPNKRFAPSPGKVKVINLPGGYGTRVDTLLYQDYEIPPYYDSMVAKVIVHGNTRLEAIRKMRRTLEEFLIEGITTNINLVYLILYNFDYLRGNYNTGFIDKNLDSILSISDGI